jgi:hypothetical protein
MLSGRFAAARLLNLTKYILNGRSGAVKPTAKPEQLSQHDNRVVEIRQNRFSNGQQCPAFRQCFDELRPRIHPKGVRSKIAAMADLGFGRGVHHHTRETWQ